MNLCASTDLTSGSYADDAGGIDELGRVEREEDIAVTATDVFRRVEDEFMATCRPDVAGGGKDEVTGERVDRTRDLHSPSVLTTTTTAMQDDDLDELDGMLCSIMNISSCFIFVRYR